MHRQRLLMEFIKIIENLFYTLKNQLKFCVIAIEKLHLQPQLNFDVQKILERCQSGNGADC